MAKRKQLKMILISAMVILLLLQMAVLFYYGTKKAGFHEDEFYSYYSTNKTAGLTVNDREWMDRDSYRNDFVVLKGEEFRYGVAAMMQSWDVHPPFYYFVLHTVCSFFPGIFSKWLGISVNIAAFVPCFILLWVLCYTAATAGGDDENERKMGIFIASITCMVWGFSAAVISGVMFIRMYQWLTLFVLMCAVLHIRAVKRKECRLLSFYLPLMITVYLGFLTQYYYIIFHVFIGLGFCFLLLKNKKVKQFIAYGASCAVSLFLAILSYPASLSHIFRGYRGTEAVNEFANASNTWERIRFFTGLLSDYVFNGTLFIWILLICILLVTGRYLKSRKKLSVNTVTGKYAAAGLLIFAGAGYFITISKTALLLGETSNRYQLPVYGILIFIFLYLVCVPFVQMLEGISIIKNDRKDVLIKAAGLLFVLLLIIMDGMALKDGRVFFLYEEEKPVMEYVQAHSDLPAVVFYNEASSANVWRLSDELMELPRIYLASHGNKASFTDETILNSKELLVYVADYENKEDCLKRLLVQNENLSGYQVIAVKGLFTLYHIF